MNKYTIIVGAALMAVVGVGCNVQTVQENQNTNTVATNTDTTNWGVCEQQPKQQFTPPPDGTDLNQIDLLIATSNDGKTFGTPQTVVQGGGVPSITTGLDGKLVAVFNWFPDYDSNPEAYNKVGVIISEDDGTTWTEPQMLCLKDIPENYQTPYDPTITTTADGNYRLFFTTHKLGLDEKFTYGSALSEDGIHYVWESGEAFSYDTDIVDGSEVRVGDKWYMIAPLAMQNGKAVDAVSTDGKTFTLSSSNRSNKIHWAGNMVNNNGTIYFYGGGGSNGKMVYSTTTDGQSWTEPVLTNAPGGDTGIALTQDGTFVLFYPEPKK